MEDRWIEWPIEALIQAPVACACGMRHETPLKKWAIGTGSIMKTPQFVSDLGWRRPLLVCDENTFRVAGEKTRALLEKAGIPCGLVTLRGDPKVLPDERAVGAVMLAWSGEYDSLLGVGSGVINDVCKLSAHRLKAPCGIVATAPSMDGYASDSSAMERDGIKQTIYTTCPALIIADTAILANAPMPMILSGIGDMAAKYVSLCEWRIAHEVMGEKLCENAHVR